MDKKKFKELLKKNGAFLLHIGFLVKNLNESMKYLDDLPGFTGEWTFIPINATTDKWEISTPHEFKTAATNLFNTTPIELVQPIEGKCHGTHFEEYLNKHGEGMHHIAFGFPRYKDYKKVIDVYISEGYEMVHHARGPVFEGTPNEFIVDYCYLKIPTSGAYIELNWDSIKK